MKWNPVTEGLKTSDLRFPVLLLDSKGFVMAFVDHERLLLHMSMASMGLERDFPITHWAHFNLPPKKPRKPKTETEQ